MEHTLLKRHKEVPGCVWKPGMVGPGCRPPLALKKAAMAGKDSYYDMEKYSRITTWVLLAMLGVVMFRGFVSRLRHSSNSKLSLSILAVPGYKTVAAVCRGIGYYRPKRVFARKTVLSEIVSADRFPAMGNILMFAVPAIGFVCWCFAVHPYYRPAAVWGSTPLGVRAGMIANAFFPWLFAFGLKFNPLTFLTSISHEKLQFYHQWTARIILFFAIVHTVPFLYQPVHDGGWSNLKEWYYYDKIWWTGTVALAVLFWLVVSSFGWFRKMSYEFFVAQHVVSIVLFLVFYFMHTRDLLHSWAWLWPSVGVWGFHVLMKGANSLRISRFTGVSATVTLVDGDEKLLKLECDAPVGWLPGQHFFLRFPGYQQIGTVPVASFYGGKPAESGWEYGFASRVLFKARDGLTKKIWEQLVQQPAVKGKVSTSLKVALDGPYGSPFHPAAYHSDLMIAGGVGMTSVLPALMSLCISARSRNALTTKVVVHWSVQTMRILDAFEPLLVPVLDHLRALGVDATLHVYCREDREKDEISLAKSSIAVHNERVNLPSVVSGFVDDAAKNKTRTVGVSVCGPVSMLNETANTVARCQWSHVLKGNSIDELYLHSEAFAW